MVSSKLLEILRNIIYFFKLFIASEQSDGSESEDEKNAAHSPEKVSTCSL